MALLGNYELPNEQFSDMIVAHRMEFPDTAVFEDVAVSLIDSGFELNSCIRFVRQICRWGGYYGIAARVLGANQPNNIQAALQESYLMLVADPPNNQAQALARINQLHQLGRPSFASKFLRFLCPSRAVILDRIIGENSQLPVSLNGYAQASRSCIATATTLNGIGILNPIRANGIWLAADVEAAFYANMLGFQ
jgi:hypothetical protein